jgi:predicted hydrocarbon binding protein
MSDTSPAPREEAATQESAQESSDGFRPELPLAILESVRHHDRPAEVLEDEDLPRSLPRRLGLTGVVDAQIHRYRTAQKRRERVSTEQVADLLRLVLRRPDAEPILRQAGRDIARVHGYRPERRLATLHRFLPPRLRARIAERSVRRLLRRIGGGVTVRVDRSPFRVEIDRAVTARLDEWGTACVLYEAAIAQVLHSITGHPVRVAHVACEANGAPCCAWNADNP